MPMPAANDFPCSGCSALAAELNRERRGLNAEVAAVKERLKNLRGAVCDATGLPPTVSTDPVRDDATLFDAGDHVSLWTVVRLPAREPWWRRVMWVVRGWF